MRHLCSVVALLTIAALSSPTMAVSVSFHAAEIDGTAAEWRTPTTPKPNDIDGDDIYGTYTAVLWTDVGTYTGQTISFLSSGSQFQNAGYSPIDSLIDDDGGATDALAGIVLNEHTFRVNADLTDQVLRVGVMHDTLSAGEYAADFGWSASLTHTVSGSGGATGATATSTILPGANGIVDMLFFDITGAGINDEFQIAGISNDGRTQNPYLSSVTWDIAPLEIPMELSVNKDTGVVTILNSSGTDQDVKGYSISSDLGQLNPSGWTSLQDVGFADQGSGAGNTDPNDGIGWEELGTGTTDLVGEFNLQSSSIFGPGGTTSQSLGSLFTPQSEDGDLVFTLSFANGTTAEGLVTYITGGFIGGDYNGDGTVDLADYTIWRNNLGGDASTAFPAGTRDPSASGPIGTDDYTFWRNNFGNSVGVVAQPATVPEPGAIALCLTAIAGIVFYRSPSSSSLIRAGAALVALFFVSFLLSGASTALEIDRNYTFGDDDTDVSTPFAGDAVGSTTSTGDTFDAAGAAPGEFVDLTPNGDPRYASISRPLGGSGLGIEFTAATSDYLIGDRLGLPETSFSAAGGNNTGPLDYAGLANRGFQLWVNPAASGLGNTTAQTIVADTLQHGVAISAADTWVMRYAGAEFDSGITVNSNQWYHVMVVRPFGPTGPDSGSRLYVDGVAVAAATGGYDGTGDDTPLVVGAVGGELGTVAGTAEFFSGTLDDLEMFVLGTTTSDPPSVYGEFDFAVDNEFAASVLTGYVPGDTNGDGIVQGDGTLAPGGVDDVATFIANYRETSLISVGDINSPALGDFNFDGITDIEDWILLRTNHTAPGGLSLGTLLAGQSVPEPSAAIVLASAVGLLYFCRRGKSRHARRESTIDPGVGFDGQQASAVVNVSSLMSILALVVLMGTSSAVNVNLDFQGTQTPGLGGDPIVTQPSFTAFETNRIAAVPDPTPTIDPSITVDGITFSIIGTVGAFGTAGSGNDALDSDFMFLGSALGYSESITWSISGLDPSTEYDLLWYAATEGADNRSALIESGGFQGEVRNDNPDLLLSLTSDGSGVITGTATRNGTSVEANLAGLSILDEFFPANPELQIDRSTGAMTFINNTATPLSVVGYEILSADGALNPGSWTSIADSNSAWIELTTSTDRDNLAEVEDPQGAGIVLANGGGTINLGTPWLQSPTEDVAGVRLALADNTLIDVDVSFVGNNDLPLNVGDFDGDGVDVDDWNVLKPLFGSDPTNGGLASPVEQYRAGDLNGDGAVDFADFNTFANSFDVANGAGAFAAIGSAVPEPSSISILIALGVMSMGLLKVRRQ